jgi:hypothetical protein
VEEDPEERLTVTISDKKGRAEMRIRVSRAMERTSSALLDSKYRLLVIEVPNAGRSRGVLKFLLGSQVEWKRVLTVSSHKKSYIESSNVPELEGNDEEGGDIFKLDQLTQLKDFLKKAEVLFAREDAEERARPVREAVERILKQ